MSFVAASSLAVMVSSTPPSTSLIAVAAPSTMFGQLAILPSGGVDEAEGAGAAEDATPVEATGGGGGGNRTIEAMLLRGRETSFG